MSSFLVPMLTINQMVATISSLLRSDPDHLTAQMFIAAGIDIRQSGWEKRLAKAMFALNQEALHQRYGDPAEEHFIYRRVPSDANLYQTLKSVKCWLYQSSEGTVPESELYRFFKMVVRVWLLETIVSRLPEYEQAEWG